MSKDAVYLITEKSGLRRIVRKTAQMRAYLNNYNHLNPNNQYKWIEMDEDAAITEIKTNGQHVQVTDPKVDAIAKVLTEKDAEIEMLKAQLAAANGITQLAVATEVIAKINEAKTVEEIDELIKNDTRITVINAATKAKLKLV